MKNTKRCPKCGCDVILKVGYDPIWYRNQYIPVGITMFSAVPVTRYVCTGCGYSEEWIDKADIPRLREKYPRVY